MNIGMSLACFYPEVPEDVIPIAAQTGMKQCELFLNTVSEIDPAYLRSVRKKCDEAGIEVYSIHPFTSALENYLFFMPYERRIKDATDFYRQYADAARILGARVINIHGDRGLALDDYDQYVACLSPLMELQKETGIFYSLENVYYNSVNCPEIVARLKRDVPEVRFTFDIKQAHKGSRDPYAVLRAMGDSIVNFHINDFDEEHICLLPGQGVMDYRSVFSMLKEFSYRGPALIEVYRSNFLDINDIKNAKIYLENELMLAN